MTDLGKPLPLQGVVSYLRREVLVPPNFVTACRVGCTVAMFVVAGQHIAVFLLAFGAAASDAVDGFVAKRYGWCTRFGKRFDQYSDWLFGVALMYAIYEAGGFTWYNVPLLGLIGLYMTVRFFVPFAETSAAGKTKTILQFSGCVLVLAGHAFDSGPVLALGYLTIWASLGLMAKAAKDYFLR